LKIRATQTSETLLKIIKNPITDHVPLDCLKIGTSTKARLVDVNQYVKTIPRQKDVLFSVGAVSHGNPGMENDYV